MKRTLIVLIAVALLGIFPVQARIILPSVIADNMVLQQNQKVTIWGWSTIPNEKINVTGSWNNQTVAVNADATRWKVQLQTTTYGGPYTITIAGSETVTIHNVMLGEVWLASGQSNMEMCVDSVSKGFAGVLNREQEIASANLPQIRMFTVLKQTSDNPQDKCEGEWQVCTPENVKLFSATAYFFAKNLHQSLHVPIGIISTSWGGTNAETWVRKELITENAVLSESVKTLKKNTYWPVAPGSIYNAMLHPLQNYTIKGAIWYQGEANRKNASTYKQLMTTLITSWRAGWGYDFPFYYTQIAPYRYHDDANGALIPEAQLQTLVVPQTGMAVTNDIGNLGNIHPKNKQEVGRRLALWALANDYHQNIAFSGPLYTSKTIEGKTIVLHFDHTQGGLMAKGKTLTDFYISGADHVFMPAVAKIKGETVIVFNKNIKIPAAVRFAFSDTAQPNLYNGAGLPASCFRTDW